MLEWSPALWLAYLRTNGHVTVMLPARREDISLLALTMSVYQGCEVVLFLAPQRKITGLDSVPVRLTYVQ